MDQRTLGKTGIKVSRLGIGGLQISSKYSRFDGARETIHRAVDLGVNYTDTAPSYGNSELVLGRTLDEIQTPLIVSTKLGGRPQPFDPQNRDQLQESLETSLRLLGRNHIDILFIHEPDRPGYYDWWKNNRNFEGPVLDLLKDLKREGTIRAIGIAGTTAYRMADLIRTGKFDIVLTAFNYSLLWREAEREILPAAVENGLGIIIGSPLQQGAIAQRQDKEIETANWISPPRREQIRKLYAFLDEVDMTLAECAIRFVISNPHIDCTLMGARSSREVELNVASVEKGPLNSDILRRLDKIASLVPFRPFDEPFGFPFGREYKGPGRA
ncbi:MAG: NADH-specific methylglyoxal reductase [Candidatus Moanabacter tarae]|uniref:NADH-specific methylglyoxal reductase n=1 Tax=Candidatus Moanibacter tarae TaxID=2200854 RepID=A0A2Z4ADA0_9BACT|nr:MAG: NADH-specific methylglyoxal reductase [Candidatus Moanabacter tarae]|tara:strand:- start:2169 stop:3149 length:981 start_codon:yes stop_codon:yes gene_type:complete